MSGLRWGAGRSITRSVLVVLAVAGATAAIPASPALANTLCIAGQNAGYSNGGSGNSYWGWCHPNGGTVNYEVEFHCGSLVSFFTNWASGSGYGAVYTNAISNCPRVDKFTIYNG
jgi:hypothetical protein